MVVFDETIVGDEVAQPKIIRHRRKSGYKTINIERKRYKDLGSYMLFSFVDGTTPYEVFVIRKDSFKGVMTKDTPFVQTNEKGL